VEKLFGLPVGQLMVGLLIVFGLGVLVMAYQALRNPVVFKMGVRNIPRRRAQTVLVVLGLMLATVLFSASLATGDTLTHSIRVNFIRAMGQVDEVVLPEQLNAAGHRPYFDAAELTKVQAALSQSPLVEGIAPIAQEAAPVIDVASGLSEPRVNVLGVDAASMSGVGPLLDEKGELLAVADLAEGEAYVSAELSKSLDAKAGHTLNLYLGAKPTALQVRGVYAEGAHPATELSLVLPLAQVQTITGNQGKINGILINNTGDEIKGAEHTDAVVSALKPLLEGSGLKVNPLKQERLKQADEAGNSFATVFLLFGQFSIAAGVLLIFLIFIMLAAERQRELGIARAVGMQRGHLIRMFAFEGAMYSLLAAAVGSLLGLAVGWVMVRIIMVAFSEFDFTLTYSFNWRSVVIAYTMGMVLTFAIVLVSSWRVSRLNIVRAVRELPEPPRSRRSLWGLVLPVLVIALGALSLVSGLNGEQAAPFDLGASLIIIGVPLLARRFGLADRWAFTIAGAGLVLWWLYAGTLLEPVLPKFKAGIEMFFLSGIMIVLGAVWAVVYNANVLLWAMVSVFGRIKGLTPVLRVAIAYPMSSRSRTGMTLAMISLVMFTLVVMAFITHAIGSVLGDPQKISGGFTVQASTSYANPIADLRPSLAGTPGVNADDITAIGGISGAGVKVRQSGIDGEFKDLFVQGVDAGFSQAITYGFAMTAAGYETPQAVWEALQKEPRTAVVAAWMVPSKTNYNVGGPVPPLQLQGFYQEDKTLPDVHLTIHDPRTGAEHDLRVIGVMEQTAFLLGGLVTSQDTANLTAGQRLPSITYMVRTNDGVDVNATAKALEAGFREHGMQAVVLADEIRKDTGANLMINNLLQGFMGLGLVVGIAALGVIAARAVVERRHQIGMLRALGFQRSMVQAAFLTESSFLALLGIFMGIALGMGLSPQIIKSFQESFPGMKYEIPWGNIVIVVGLAYAASLLTTFLPAQQAARIDPADALRYE